MKKFFLLLCSFLFFNATSQTNYVFNVELSDRETAPSFILTNGVLLYNGTDNSESAFFANYTILKFYQTYPSSSVSKSLNVFTFETTSPNLMGDLIIQFPGKYSNIEDLTGHVLELLYYPNDYGNTSPIPNLGFDISMKNLDYINVPKAWDFFNENDIGNVTIGISDGKIHENDIEFSNKTNYLNLNQFSSSFNCVAGNESRHGTSVAAIAAAQGNNGYGTTGICPDCEILNVPYTLTYNGLLDLANNGVKVINMSWAYNSYEDLSYQNGFFPSQQEIINQIHNLGVVLVAAAGNNNSFNYPNWQAYAYPACYEHVISVSGVNHKNANIGDEQTGPIPPFGMVSLYVEDLVSPSGAIDYNGEPYYPFAAGLTTNTRVDICAPAYQISSYSSFLLNCLDEYGQPNYDKGNGTSQAAPHVTGTVALMQSLNSCILPDEVEDVLQLTSKNLESNPYNAYFIGRSGSGKLETGDAVEFVYEMMNANGNCLIDGQDFWRFNFDLKHIYNKLTISNQIFRESNTSNFTAKNEIDITLNTDFRPSSNGFVDLNIDSDLTICDSSSRFANINNNNPKKDKINLDSSIKLFPNPNKGIFSVKIDKANIRDLSINVLDIFGKLIYSTKVNEANFVIEIPNLSDGIYFVKILNNEINETLKFIKK